jgi:methyltransferase-like protein 23
LWERRNHLQHKRVLEIGSGTSLPGILAAKCGAQVTLSDCNQLPKTLAHIKKCCLLNNLIPGKDIQVVGITWGLLLNNIFTLGELDLIVASDCFYDPSVFEDILVTVSFLLEANRHCKFIFTYQERSTDWAIEALLKKWDLKCVNINLDNLGIDCGIDVRDLMGGHTINLFEISHR